MMNLLNRRLTFRFGASVVANDVRITEPTA
jgi:hypothetical protein